MESTIHRWEKRRTPIYERDLNSTQFFLSEIDEISITIYFSIIRPRIHGGGFFFEICPKPYRGLFCSSFSGRILWPTAPTKKTITTPTKLHGDPKTINSQFRTYVPGFTRAICSVLGRQKHVSAGSTVWGLGYKSFRWVNRQDHVNRTPVEMQRIADDPSRTVEACHAPN